MNLPSDIAETHPPVFLQAAVYNGRLYAAPLGTPFDLDYARTTLHIAGVPAAREPGAWVDAGPAPDRLASLSQP